MSDDVVIYGAQRIPLELLEEKGLRRIKVVTPEPAARPTGDVVITCATPLHLHRPVPGLQLMQKGRALRWKLGKLWLDWDVQRQLFLPWTKESFLDDDSWGEPFLMAGIDYAFMPPHPLNWVNVNQFAKEMYQQPAPEPEPPPPKPPSRIRLFTEEKSCGHCPLSLTCLRRKPFSPVLFSFTACPRCHCLYFERKCDEPDGIYVCALLRHEYRSLGDPASVLQAHVSGFSGRALATAPCCCITRWQPVGEYKKRGTNKLTPEHVLNRSKYRYAPAQVSSYDCVQHLRYLADYYCIPMEINGRSILSPEEAAWDHAREAL